MPARPRGRAAALLAAALLASASFLAPAAAGPGLPAAPPLPPVPASPLVPAAPPADPDGLPAYEPQVERLAERLGTLALMRDLCGDGDAARFRDRMAALVDAEGHSPAARDRLAGAFNRGFRGYAASYRACTPSARLVIARSLAEADRLTRDLVTRYGGT